MRVAALCLVACACTGSVGPLGDTDSGAPDASTVTDGGFDAGVPDAGAPDASVPDSGTRDAGAPDASAPDAGPADAGDFCNGALLCERFDEYPLGTLHDGQTFGPWRVTVGDSNAAAAIDETHNVTGDRALKVHLENGQVSVATITTQAAPLFSSTRTKLYARFRMFMAQNATSQNWQLIAFSGNLPQGVPNAGSGAVYYFNSFDDGSGHNEWGAVYYNSGSNADCNTPGSQNYVIGQWTCVATMVDSVARQYRLSVDGVPVPSVSVDDKGLQCVDHTSNPWYGPDFSTLEIGIRDYHPMRAQLDMWIDDLVVDTKPVNCP